jgi:hypothetical protein
MHETLEWIERPVAHGGVIERSLRDPEGFAAVFHRYYAPIHGFASRRLGPALPTTWPRRRS